MNIQIDVLNGKSKIACGKKRQWKRSGQSETQKYPVT